MSRLFLQLFIFLFCFHSLATGKQDNKPISIAGLFQRHEKHKEKITNRYNKIFTLDNGFFSPDDKKLINKKKLEPIIDKLIFHKRITIKNTDDLLDYALRINKSKLDTTQIINRTSKYIKKGKLNAPALTEAIEKQYLSEYKQKKILYFQTNNNLIVQHIENLPIKRKYKDKAISAYALCIAGFYDKKFRKRALTPKICEPNIFYNKPKHVPGKYLPRTNMSHNPDSRTMAYQTLVLEGKKVADRLNLNDFERIMMAKCISRSAIRFFVPIHHPAKALVRTVQISTKAPDKALFKHDGVCSNFCALAYNVVSSIGTDAEIYLARRRNLHTYLEVKINDRWYHTHPFQGVPRDCDFTEF